MSADLFASLPQAVDHRCLGCGQHHPDAVEVTLVDGRKVSSYSEEWRLECEARSILSMSPLHRRQWHLQDIEKRRGNAAAYQLRDKMLEIWEAGRGQKATA